MTAPDADPDPPYNVELAPASPTPRQVIAAEPEPPAADALALASTFEDARVHEGRSDEEIDEAAHAAALAAADAAIAAAVLVALDDDFPDPDDFGIGSHPDADFTHGTD